MMYASSMTSFRCSYKSSTCAGLEAVGHGKQSKSDLLNTCTNSPDILLREVTPHGSNHRLDLCLCLV